LQVLSIVNGVVLRLPDVEEVNWNSALYCASIKVTKFQRSDDRHVNGLREGEIWDPAVELRW
jgi:hypothetical protein